MISKQWTVKDFQNEVEFLRKSHIEKSGISPNELIPWSPSYQLGRYFGERFRQEYDDIDQARLALSISATENADEVELEKGFLDGWQAPLVTPSGVAETGRRGGREA